MNGIAATADLLFDSDVFIDHIRGARRLPAIGGSYSTITRCELLAGRARDEVAIRVLLQPLKEIVVDRAVAERAGKLRRGSAIATADALIAATALENSLDLVTRNRRDFEGVAGLTLRDPSTLI